MLRRQQVKRLGGRRVKERGGEFGVLAAPGRQVVEGLFGPDGGAVEAEQESLGGGISGTLDLALVEPPEERLAHVGGRDDRLHRGVVSCPFVEELFHAREELGRRKVVYRLRLPLFDYPGVAGKILLPPELLAALAGQHPPHRAGGQTQHLPRQPGREDQTVVGVAVDGSEPHFLFRDDARTEELVEYMSERLRHRLDR
jgi:hypothetical protein